MADGNSSIMKESDDVTLNFGEEEELDQQKRLKHPVAVFFHIFFRAGALLTYFLCEFFSSSFITNFIVIILLLCMDFWTVKNVTGRLLVGLRWWNYVDDKGESHWVFESRKGTPGSRKISAIESRIFWLAMVVSQILWVVFFITALFRLNFKWMMVVGVGFGMNGANFYGYVRCKLGSKKKISSVARNFLTAQFIRSMFTAGPATTKPTEETTESSQPQQP
ncbi:Golgi apparatus membrane protein TVP23 homolog B-like isoform X2 [Littorina saxatilis]|uniref:Golgi apparatus membrane protein TVP23 homolog n=1 Tax=Littorina saxatilis TaxID=31220 RepID=A0AAN9GL11_9CAEN